MSASKPLTRANKKTDRGSQPEECVKVVVGTLSSSKLPKNCRKLIMYSKWEARVGAFTSA